MTGRCHEGPIPATDHAGGQGGPTRRELLSVRDARRGCRSCHGSHLRSGWRAAGGEGDDLLLAAGAGPPRVMRLGTRLAAVERRAGVGVPLSWVAVVMDM